MKVYALIAVLASSALVPLYGEIRISEFLASNGNGRTTEAGETADWIEIHNSRAEAVDLEGYYLTDDLDFAADEPETHWRFPKIAIEPGGYLVVFASGSGQTTENEWHANFKISSRGERLALIAPDGRTILTDFNPSFPPQETDVSYGYDSEGELQFMLLPTPGRRNRSGVSGFVEEVRFSVKHGFHDEPFTLALSTSTEDAEIMYTLDDREPDPGTLFTEPIGEVYSGPIEISRTTVVRALAKKEGLRDSALRTQTYLFLDDVIQQPEAPEGFPRQWGSRPSDYEMDPKVVGAIYSEEEVKAALRAAPTISLVTENDNLFSRDGIYANSQAKDLVNTGFEDKWERPVSVEFFGFPHGQTIQANAGIRLQGNASRSPNRVKHNLRIAFRAHYGPGKLRFRLFEDSEADLFNSINLRSNNGDSWIHPGVRLRAQYIRDQWHREVQRRMGQPNQSQIYAHLYINGLYWGVYHVFERFEASLLAEHFGGDEEDWDALQDTPAFQNIVVNGSDDAYRLTHNLAKRDLSVKENYDELLKYVDVDNQIDYLLLNFYSGNQDWDHKNMRYGRRRVPVEDARGNGWLYFSWDSERAGLNGLSSQSLTMDVSGKRTPLGPSFLNAQMHDNPDYHLRFVDRVVRHCFNGGELSPEGAAASWNHLAALVYEPLIGESARWGDLHANQPETREGNWQIQLDKENEVWLPRRTDVLLGQLAGRRFIPSKISFPQFEPFGGTVEEGSEVKITIFNSNIFNPASGDIHYTVDGTDPRRPDGSLYPGAFVYDEAAPPKIDQTLTMMARVYDPDGDWSPLGEAVFSIAPPPAKESLVISEIHYDPAPTSEGGRRSSAFEYIELANTSEQTIDLSGVHMTNGVSVVVDDALKATLAPGEVTLLVADRSAFALRYPDVDPSRIVGEFEDESNLNNDGERLTLRTRSGHLLHTFRYDDQAPWPEWGDEGHSLAFKGGQGANIADPGNWVVGPVGGSPGMANGEMAPPGQGGDVTLVEWLNQRGFTHPMETTGSSKVPALLYYAFGVDELAGEATLPLEVSQKGGEFVLVHHQRAGATDIMMTLESSNDLEKWTESEAEATVLETNRIVETVEVPLAREALFWRLRVSLR